MKMAEKGRGPDLRGAVLVGLEAVLVHDPVGFLAVGGSAFVKD